MFYVQVIREDGVPGKLYGPGEWDVCVEKVKSLLAAGGEEAVQLDEEEVGIIESDGCYTHEDGGGIYIVCAEPLDQGDE